ncbi:50S ribosomal protein L6 [Syntrophomonas wolfei]|uniref:Large ribosomal subunit protein uL6 n=1 Tax=Syntrophomonas wolfei subsp. wolfei (strain DSM 2245B / Goettingen) TaxID=335541 RepID=RL6_SYNWW|nr:50S ribosomal protein L6 [Syntrophomonas wolfei]Q0AUJ5.1 RecName: Full=Large ribosomal subunit protein uL6; AltName: Full=50S ribosomal protein L6 [Syntrophomonas wolfei subsp. wolfei str. Goettingen G311]ABI69609.1 LSU ribosomal protein L6P [Syntrophomonas wolfei subsp. wolfei str. Goettingen G311]
MSRIGKKPISLPAGVEVSIKDNAISVKGPKGVLEWALPEGITVVQEGNELVVKRPSDIKQHRAMHGLSRALIANMVQGVSAGFEKKLELVGVGYRAQMQGKKLVISIGFSHPVEVEPPEGIEFEVPAVTRITVKGIDKQLVGNTAAHIRAIRKPEPYKGKGIKYENEVIRRKAGKAGGK